MLFIAFTLGAVVAAVGGLAFLWAPTVPAVLLSTYIAHLRRQELKRFAFTMDRRQAEVAAQRLRERQPQRRRPMPDPVDTDEPEDGPENEENRAELTALAADRRALVEQTDHAEWVDQQRERQRRPAQGDSWDPVPVPLPTYVTAPVAPRATSGVDLGAPDAWSSARSSAADPHGSSGAPSNSAHGSGREPEGSTTARSRRRTPTRATLPTVVVPTPAGPRPRDAPASGGARRSSTSTRTATAPERPTSDPRDAGSPTPLTSHEAPASRPQAAREPLAGPSGTDFQAPRSGC